MVKIKSLIDKNPIITDWIAFGKFMINKYFLRQNILLIKYTTYSPIPWLKQHKIDEIYKEFWQEFLITGTISYGLLKQCSIEQVELTNKIFIKSKMDIDFDMDKAMMNENDINEKLQILQGELEAGNDNKKIIIEAKNIINRLYNLKKINEKERDELIEDLNSF